MKNLLDTTQLEAELERFCQERQWERFHTPKNLVMALTGEVGELNEIFQWMSEEEAAQVIDQEATMVHVGEEIADVLIYLVRLGSVLGIDLNAAVFRKIELNQLKYPPSNLDAAAHQSR